MKRSSLYLLSLLIASIGFAGMFYKWKVLKFPLFAGQEVQVWSVEARATFASVGGPNRVVLQVPSRASGEIPGFSLIDERFISRGYGQGFDKEGGSRIVEWSTREAQRKTQALYYRATVIRDDHAAVDNSKPRIGKPPKLSEPERAALDTLFDQVRAESEGTATFARAFVRKFSDENPSDEARVLMADEQTPLQRARFIARALAIRNIAARVVQGFVLSTEGAAKQLEPYLQVHDERAWVTINLKTGGQGFPEDFFLWTRADRPLLSVSSDPTASLEFDVVPDLADAISIAKRRTDVRDTRLLAYSLLSLPAGVQANYQLLLMVPVGAFMMLLLRNVIGIKTFGTFMPVLIALAFDKTKLLSGVILFIVVVGLGLLVRFFMEKIRLLLVPRLTAVLILVVVLMAFVSVVSNQLDFDVGMSVGLFPIVIMAMTIERICVAWDERGSGYALTQASGSLAVACLAYLVMSWPPLKHVFFVFPELLLVLFAMTLLIGRYSGYRLTELFRFKALAK